MRQVINISLPEKLADVVEREVKTGQYATKSEFFRDLLRLWEEEKILQNLRKSQQDILNGKCKILKSLKDLR
ncbi:MAG: ribbon-helix-helix domain-containing protein [Patescibacteria group bacterium]